MYSLIKNILLILIKIVKYLTRKLYKNLREANILTVAIFILMLFTATRQRYIIKSSRVDTIKIVEYRYKTPAFIEKSPEEGLEEAMNYYKIKYPDIVKAQAVLETGNFSSNVCKNKNNLFGLYDFKNKKYYEFSHWSESVKAYKKYIQSRYRSDSSYYSFLESINYASNPNYINLVKKIVNSNKDNKN